MLPTVRHVLMWIVAPSTMERGLMRVGDPVATPRAPRSGGPARGSTCICTL